MFVTSESIDRNSCSTVSNSLHARLSFMFHVSVRPNCLPCKSRCTCNNHKLEWWVNMRCRHDTDGHGATTSSAHLKLLDIVLVVIARVAFFRLYDKSTMIQKVILSIIQDEHSTSFSAAINICATVQCHLFLNPVNCNVSSDHLTWF